MKRLQQTWILTIKLSLIVLLTFLHGCKKNNSSTPPNDHPIQTMQPVLDAIKAKNTPLSFTRILNLPGKGYWADENGNQIRRSTASGRLLACPDPGEDYPTQSVYSVLVEFTCGQGYRIEVKYDVTLVYTPLLTNASNIPSFGRVWLFNSGGTRIWPTGTPLPKHSVSNITNMGSAGTDPNGLPLIKYRVTFKTEYIPSGVYEASSQLQTYLSVYTDCPNYPTFVCAFSPQQGELVTQPNYFPCLRIDKVNWNPSFGLGASLNGVQATPLSCFPNPYVLPDRQEIEILAGGIWQPIRLWRWQSNPPPPPADQKEYNVTGLIYTFDLWYINMQGYNPSNTTLTNGNYQVRYRNRQISTNAGGPCVSEPDGTWVTETWFLSI